MSKPMRLLYIAESFPTTVGGDLTGGVEAGDWYTATALAKKHDVTVITAARNGVSRDQRLKGLRIIRAGQPVSASQRESVPARITFIREALEIIPQLDFELMHASNTLTQWIALQANKSLQRKVVARIADVYKGSWINNTNVMTGLVGEYLENTVLRGEWHRIISWSQATKDKLVKSGRKENTIDIVYGGIEHNVVNRAKVFKRKHPTICSITRLVKYKHVDTLIMALASLRNRHPGIKLEIIGDGPERANLENLTSKLNLQSKVSFLGSISLHSHVLKRVKAATVFSLASTVEGFGLATLEACSAGVPYVNVNTPATAEITKGGKGGLLVPQNDPRALADHIDLLLSDAKMYNTKVREAKRLALNYDWTKTSQQTEKIFSKVIQNHS